MRHISSIIVWGDSIAKGVIFDESRNRYVLSPTTAAGMVAKELGAELVNHARMGSTVIESKQIVEKDLERGVRADVAILEIGGNDCDFNWKEVSETPGAPHLPRIPAEEYARRYEEIITDIKKANMTPVLFNLPPIDADRYFDFISRDGLSKENILSWLGDKNHIYRYHEMYSNRVARLAEKTGCRFFDVRTRFLEQWNPYSLMCADGIHPNEEGQKLIGNYILSCLA